MLMGARAPADNHALRRYPVIRPRPPVAPLTPRFPGSVLHAAPIRHCDVNIFLPCRMADTYGPTLPAWQLKGQEESPINDGSWGSSYHPPTSPDRKLISSRLWPVGARESFDGKGVVPSLQAATVMGLSTSSVFPSRCVLLYMGMQSFCSLDLARRRHWRALVLG